VNSPPGRFNTNTSAILDFTEGNEENEGLTSSFFFRTFVFFVIFCEKVRIIWVVDMKCAFICGFDRQS